MELVNTRYDQRYLFFGTFDRFSMSNGSRGVSSQIILKDIKDQYGNRIAKYISFNYVKTFSSLQLVSGDIVSFYARVLEYKNAYPEPYNFYYPEIHYRLFYPTKAKKLIKPVQSNKIKEDSTFKIHIKTR